jgi:hypothetical protein
MFEQCIHGYMKMTCPACNGGRQGGASQRVRTPAPATPSPTLTVGDIITRSVENLERSGRSLMHTENAVVKSSFRDDAPEQ